MGATTLNNVPLSSLTKGTTNEYGFPNNFDRGAYTTNYGPRVGLTGLELGNNFSVVNDNGTLNLDPVNLPGLSQLLNTNANVSYPSLNNETTRLLNDSIRSSTKARDYDLAKAKAFDESFLGKASPYISGFSNIASGLGSLANIYTGFQQLDMMKDEIDIAKQKWATTQQEIARIQGVRDKLSADYMA